MCSNVWTKLGRNSFAIVKSIRFVFVLRRRECMYIWSEAVACFHLKYKHCIDLLIPSRHTRCQCPPSRSYRIPSQGPTTPLSFQALFSKNVYLMICTNLKRADTSPYTGIDVGLGDGALPHWIFGIPFQSQCVISYLIAGCALMPSYIIFRLRSKMNCTYQLILSHVWCSIEFQFKT